MNFYRCSLLFFIVLHPHVLYAKKKVVKLIVPQKIKYIHHTHVLLVKPSYGKKAPVIREELIEELPYRDSTRSKSKVRYVLPYFTESKEVSYRVPLDEHYVEAYRRGIEEVHSPSRNKPQAGDEYAEDSGGNWFKPQSHYPMPSLEEEPPAEYHTIPIVTGQNSMGDMYPPLLPEMSPDSYSYSDQNMQNSNNNHYEKVNIYYRAPQTNPYRMHVTTDTEGGSAMSAYSSDHYSYLPVEDSKSYYDGRTDSYGAMLPPPTTFASGWGV